MKKLYTTLLTIAATALSIQAQQLPNPGFEEAWEDCTPWTSEGNTKVQGTQPKGWISANTIGTGGNSPLGNTTVVEPTTGYNSNGAAQANNLEISVKVLFFNVKKTIPGYFALGTPWSTSTGTGSNMDGGTFGGIPFTYRPDAISFQYKSTGSTDRPTVVAYTWSGHCVQADVPGNIVTGNSATKSDMTDRDRIVLGMDMTDKQGGDVTSNTVSLISSINTRLEATTSDWTYSELEFEYKNGGTPEQINVIFGAGDYFNVTPVKDNSITVDDIKLLYYSRLSELSVNGTPVNSFDPNNFAYTIDAEMPTDASAISYTTMGNSGSTTENVALDKENAQVLVTVTNDNVGGTDIDGETSHTYTLQFNKNNLETPEEPTDKDAYKGSLHVVIKDMNMDTTQDDQTVYIENTGAGKCIFSLPNFSFGDIPVGDIVLNDVTVTENADGTFTYSGSAKNMKLGPDKDEEGNDVPEESKLDVDVTLNGTIDATGKAQMIISVIWHVDKESADMFGIPENTPIEVEFNGQGPKPTAAIDDITVDNSTAPVEYYNLQGMRINASNLTPGIYIRRQGTEVTKIYVR